MVEADNEGAVLDSGAIIGLSRGNRQLAARLAGGRRHGAEIAVPMVVVAETTRGNGPRDTALNFVISRCEPPRPLDEPTARLAGLLLAEAGGSNTIDALVVAEALNRAPTVLFTSDPDDISKLLGARRGVKVVAI